ncbi:hypothetical protein CLOM_g2646, partial [Closterium sp. NIES-68]
LRNASRFPVRLIISRLQSPAKVNSSTFRISASSSSSSDNIIPSQDATSSETDTSAWPEPPALGFDYRKATADATYRIVGQRYPELMDLVRKGVLVVVQQPADDHDDSAAAVNEFAENESARIRDGISEQQGSSVGTMSNQPGSAGRSSLLPREIFILGTTHVSETAAEDARRVVQSVQPQNVVVELCKSRAPIMYDPAPEPNQPLAPGSAASGSAGTGSASASSSSSAAAGPARDLFLMGGASLPQALMRSIQLGGQSSLLLRLLLSFVSRRSGQAAGVQPGHEFRAAREAADAIGAQLVLGDRPIEITLRRAWKALSPIDRTRLASALFQGGLKGGKMEQGELKGALLKGRDSSVKRMGGDGTEGGDEEVEFLSAVFQEVARQFPTVIGPLVHERDAYLAWALKRSKAVRGCDRVVGVVGRGHLPGVVHYLQQDNQQRTLRFKQLVGASASDEKDTGKGGMAVRVARRVGIEVAVGLGLWWAFSLIS